MALGISRDKWGWPIPRESIPTHPQGMHPHPYLSHSFYKPELQYLITVLIFAKKLRLLESICESNQQTKINFFFHDGIVEIKSRDFVNKN